MSSGRDERTPLSLPQRGRAREQQRERVREKEGEKQWKRGGGVLGSHVEKHRKTPHIPPFPSSHLFLLPILSLSLILSLALYFSLFLSLCVHRYISCTGLSTCFYSINPPLSLRKEGKRKEEEYSECHNVETSERWNKPIKSFLFLLCWTSSFPISPVISLSLFGGIGRAKEREIERAREGKRQTLTIK